MQHFAFEVGDALHFGDAWPCIMPVTNEHRIEHFCCEQFVRQILRDDLPLVILKRHNANGCMAEFDEFPQIESGRVRVNEFQHFRLRWIRCATLRVMMIRKVHRLMRQIRSIFTMQHQIVSTVLTISTHSHIFSLSAHALKRNYLNPLYMAVCTPMPYSSLPILSV